MASSAPLGHPTIPETVSANELVAIVTIHDVQGLDVNRDTPYHKAPVRADGAASGIHIYLHRTLGQPYFTIGREPTEHERAKPNHETRDVYLPGPGIGPKQFTLLPIWDSNCWRLQSTSEIVSTTNGVPIQHYNLRTKKNKIHYPHAIHLTQTQVNRVVIRDLQIDIWIMNTVRDLHGPQDFIPAALQANVQDVTGRPEDWARERYMIKEQISSKSHRVLERFNGEAHTAKLFHEEHGGIQRRDREFLMLSKAETETSIVRYIQTAATSTIPAVITSTHEGFASYRALRHRILRAHPGFRFAIAAKMLRRLFSALAYLHYHGIIHGHVSNDSVLLRLEDDKVEDVLLVDYTTANSFTPGAPVPVNDMVADGEAVMRLIDDCCDLWAIRNGPTPDADGEYRLEQITKKAMEDYQTIQRCASDYFERNGNSKTSEKGKKLSKLLEKSGLDWQSARANQEHNLKRRQINVVMKSKLEDMKAEWSKTHDPPRVGEEQYMLLSLGHAYLDGLANPLFFKRWDLTPHQVCARIREYGGDLEHPWQTFKVKVVVQVQHDHDAMNEQDLMSWLAHCGELYPLWREALQASCAQHLHPKGGSISRHAVDDLYNNLQVLGRLPASMVAMFERMRNLDQMRNRVEEIHDVWYHIPSRMFNLTQLQRLASPERLSKTVNEGKVRCENFVEVRGEPKIEGNYAPLSLLTDFARAFGLSLLQDPHLVPVLPTFDPSDFSQTLQGQMVLARRGMLGYGYMVRSGDQCNYANPKDSANFQTPSSFIPTNFGDMRVLPQLPTGVRSHDRPEHWSWFKTAKEYEASADLTKRRILPVRARPEPAGKARGTRATSSPLTPVKEVDESLLGEMLKEREDVRARACPPTKRSADAIPSKPMTPEPKRARSFGSNDKSPRPTAALLDITESFVQRMEEQMKTPPNRDRPGASHPTLPTLPSRATADHLTPSFMKRNSALMSSPPRDPTNFDQSFTVADDTETLEEDWAKVNEMLKYVTAGDENEEPQVQGIFGFRIHHDGEDDDDNATDVGTVVDANSFVGMANSFAGKGKGKAPVSLFDEASDQSMTKSFTSRFAQQNQPSSRSFLAATSSHRTPTAPFKHQRNKLSEVSNASEDLAPTQSWSPVQTHKAAPSSGPFGTPGSAGGSRPTYQPNASSSPNPNVRSGGTTFGTHPPDATVSAPFGYLGFGASSSNKPAARPLNFMGNPQGNPSGISPTPGLSFGSTGNGMQAGSAFNSFYGKPGSHFSPKASPQPKTTPKQRFGNLFTGDQGRSFGSDMPSTQANSFANNPAGSFGGSEYPDTDPCAPTPRNGSPTAGGLFQDDVVDGVPSEQQDEDMPDTDVESWNGDVAGVEDGFSGQGSGSE
ncbi:hypothetical protein FB567DRAFT_355204 [Paraphoma chrysanthemicola]|uniref:Protein kinase domain-containing protein n=1 Tax=Paraphoma chrysanthemicola TaxID=798071 RepID=A0A8K0R8C7_9PLEO|nr:hypothetical protein FB567DRAFT_355204 [Paraphoma chrysanthemicola]